MDTPRVGPGQQAAWLDDDVDDDAAFDDPAWETIDPGPVLDREQAARWLARQPRRVPIAHAAERREPVARPRERRARRARRAGSSRDGPSSESDPPPARPPLTRAERDYLRAEIDKRRRIQVRHLAKLGRELFADDQGG